MIKIKEKNYELRIKSRDAQELEKKLDKTIMEALTNMRVENLVLMLQYLLKNMQHGISLDDTYDIYDNYMEENTQYDLVIDLIEGFKASGFFTQEMAQTLEKELTTALKPTEETMEKVKAKVSQK